MEDTEIIELLKQGSGQGMQELVKKYGGLVKYIITNILGESNKRDIEECLSDVFYEFWVQIEEFDSNKGSLKSYLVGIGRYMALSRYRKISKYEKRHVLVEKEIVQEQNGGNVEEEVIQNLSNAVINEVVLEMKQPDRDIFIRRYFWFEKIKDIAKALKLDNKQVENRLYKGKEKLKKQLIKRGVDLE